MDDRMHDKKAAQFGVFGVVVSIIGVVGFVLCVLSELIPTYMTWSGILPLSLWMGITGPLTVSPLVRGRINKAMASLGSVPIVTFHDVDEAPPKPIRV